MVDRGSRVSASFPVLNAWVLPCSGKAGLLVRRSTDDSTTAKGGDHWGVVCVYIYWVDHWTFLSCRSGLYLKYFAFQMATLAKLNKQLRPVSLLLLKEIIVIMPFEILLY